MSTEEELEKRRAYHREWERQHPELVKEYAKRRYAKDRDKVLARSKKWRQDNKEWERQRWYKRTPELEAKRKLRALWKESPRSRRRFYRHSKYLSYEDYQRILPQLEAGGPCDCCGRSEQTLMHIDHNHQTMKLRGVLCQFCNKGMGHFGDDPQRLRQAAQYLERVIQGDA
jgi:hypothetical protein